MDDAYIIGRRFALFSTASLPKHDYYASPNPELARLRIKNQKDAQWVTRGVERIVEVMDKQELQKQKEQEEKRKLQKEEEERQKLEWEKKVRERLVAVESSGLVDLKSENSALDMSSKLAKLNALFPKEGGIDADGGDNDFVDDANDEQDLGPLPPPVAPPLLSEHDLALLHSTSAIQQLKSNGATPLFPKPPSYSDLFLDTLRTPSSNELPLPPPSSPSLSSLSLTPQGIMPPIPPPPPTHRTHMRTLQRTYSNQLESLHNSNHIEFIRLGTYQGRMSMSSPHYDSTNGCAVISPLVVATHIHPQQKHHRSTTQQYSHPTYGITNMAINEIIDKRAPPILRTVRSKLGLNQHALIIPSDVHDYLVDEHILPQDKFVGVCGGNILAEEHVNELVGMLVNGSHYNSNGDTKNGLKKKDSRIQKSGAGEFVTFTIFNLFCINLPWFIQTLNVSRNSWCYVTTLSTFLP